jgi:transposase-like protein/predicted nucleic acid-binding protein
LSKEQTAQDIFIINKLFPDAFASLTFQVPALSDILTDCNVVIDTNVLLAPYSAGNRSLQEIRTVYERLTKENRLFVPAQVAREFVRRRVEQTTNILQDLNNKKSLVIKPQPVDYPLIAGSAEYEQVKVRERELVEAVKLYQASLGDMHNVIKGWEWRDPISRMYGEIFTKEVIKEHSESEEHVTADLAQRYQHKRPPGYKDAGKPDSGVGDLQIWYSILEIGRKRRKPLLFVTGDEKSDWYYRVDGQPFLPRYELIDEYRLASSGAPFYIVPFSALLDHFGASQDVVTEIRDQERASVVDVEIACPTCESMVNSRLGVATGSSAAPVCSTCGEWFHIHRITDGSVITRRRFSRDDSTEEIKCPICDSDVAVQIDTVAGSSAKPSCRECGEWFHAHRRTDGSILTRLHGVSNAIASGGRLDSP